MKFSRVFLFVATASVLLAIAPRFPKADADVTPPVITAPADQSFATTTFPAIPTLIPATAGDDIDPAPVVSYAPSLFPLGTTQVVWTATDASGNFATTTSNVTITDATPPAPVAQHITLTIRDNNVTAFSGTVELPDSSASDLSILPTNNTTTVNVSPRSVLGVLESLQTSSTDFKITDLSYSESFKSFLVNCIAVPAGNNSPDCFNWTFAVNGTFPQTGMDQFKLNDGDVVYLFFGSQHKVVASKNSVTTGESFSLNAEQYDLVTGDYMPLTGVTVGLGTLNPDFSFTELATSTVDSTGQASFILNTAGTFSAGIKEDYYFPSVSVAVNNPPSGGLGSGGGGSSHLSFNIPTAAAFMANSQNADGSFDSPLSTDWAALALAAADAGGAKAKLHDYLLNNNPALVDVTDFERRAMALMALGINPYSDTSFNYIEAIIKAFDGTQIGTPNDNDDIFGLVVLEHAGFTSKDEIIKKTAAFVLSTQKANGSWDENADMTAAAISALGPLYDLPGINPALGKSVGYLLATQKPDGGWGNIDSTSWVQTAINEMIEARTPHLETESAWTSSAGLFPTDALAQAQEQDGGVKSPNRVWSTAYAITAASGKSWFTILKSFSKPSVPDNTLSNATSGGGASGGGTVLGTATSTSAVLPGVLPTTASSTTASSSDFSIIASTTLPSLTNIQPTSTPPALPKPMPKPKAKKVQPKITIAAPQVLGQVIVKPQPSSIQPTEPETPSNSENWFIRAWHSIGSFITHLF